MKYTVRQLTDIAVQAERIERQAREMASMMIWAGDSVSSDLIESMEGKLEMAVKELREVINPQQMD